MWLTRLSLYVWWRNGGGGGGKGKGCKGGGRKFEWYAETCYGNQIRMMKIFQGSSEKSAPLYTTLTLCVFTNKNKKLAATASLFQWRTKIRWLQIYCNKINNIVCEKRYVPEKISTLNWNKSMYNFISSSTFKYYKYFKFFPGVDLFVFGYPM